jgi:succinate dehydrogenase/fumarate reductase subunit D
MALSEKDVLQAANKLGLSLGEWKKVSERPGKEPFGMEIDFSSDLISGKIHVRNSGEVYVLFISKDVFNWKNHLEKLKGLKVIDAAGSFMWIEVSDAKELNNALENVIKYIKELKGVKNS